MSYKIISSETVFSGNFLKIQRDEIINHQHKLDTIEYIRHPGASVVIPLLDSETVILVKQYRHSLKTFFWEFPAGKKDPGETAIETAARELKEETGYLAQELRYLTTIHPVIGYADEEIHLFLGTHLTSGIQSLDEGEDLTLHKIKISEAFQMLKRGEISDVKTQIGLFWLQQIQEKGW